jgi:hypothetical protein
MCIICVDFDRGALKPEEARRALTELRGTLSKEHVRELEQMLDEAEDDSDPPTP